MRAPHMQERLNDIGLLCVSNSVCLLLWGALYITTKPNIINKMFFLSPICKIGEVTSGCSVCLICVYMYVYMYICICIYVYIYTK